MSSFSLQVYHCSENMMVVFCFCFCTFCDSHVCHGVAVMVGQIWWFDHVAPWFDHVQMLAGRGYGCLDS